MDQNLSFLMPLGDILQSLFHMPASRFLAKCHWNAFVMFDTCMFFLSFIFRCFAVWAMKSNFRFNVLMLTLRLNVKDMCQVGIKCCLVILSKVRIEVSIRFKMEIVPFVINNWFQKQRKQNKTLECSSRLLEDSSGTESWSPTVTILLLTVPLLASSLVSLSHLLTVFPGVTSGINYLYPIPYSRFTFDGTHTNTALFSKQ